MKRLAILNVELRLTVGGVKVSRWRLRVLGWIARRLGLVLDVVDPRAKAESN